MIFADTHVLVWLGSGDARLPADFRDLIAAGEPLFTSSVVAFEYTELHRQGRLGLGLEFAIVVDLLALAIEPLPAAAWSRIDSLPAIHRDPVDRMLIAHALVAGATLATADRQMRRYQVPLAW